MKLSFNQYSDAPVKMSSGRAITLNGKVYYGGGICNIKEEENYIYCYDPLQDKWSTLPRILVCCFSLGTVKNELVTVGGMRQERRTTDVVVFSKGKIWKHSIPPMSIARSSPAVISLRTHLVIAGGMSQVVMGGVVNIEPTSTVEIFNSNTDQWSRTDSLPYACSHPNCTVSNNTLYLLGGTDGENRLCKVITAQIDELISNCHPLNVDRESANNCSAHNSAWKQCTDTPSYNPSVIAVSDTVFAVGGVDGADKDNYSPLKGIHAYSPSLDYWVYMGDLPLPMAFSAILLRSSTAFAVIGGKDVCKNRLSIFHDFQLNVLLH